MITAAARRLRRVGEHVAAARDAPSCAAPVSAGKAWRDSASAVGPSRAGAARGPGEQRLAAVGGRQTSSCGIRRSDGRCSTAWCVGPSRQADRVVREDVDHALLHQRGHADRVAAVVAEGQEGAAVGDETAVQRDAVHDRRHAELAHAVAACRSPQPGSRSGSTPSGRRCRRTARHRRRDLASTAASSCASHGVGRGGQFWRAPRAARRRSRAGHPRMRRSNSSASAGCAAR